MTRIAGQVAIDAPVAAVFDMVADERNEPRYNPRIARARMTSQGPVGAGAQFVADPRGMGSRGEMTLTILDYDRPHRLHNLVTSSFMNVDGNLTFEGSCGGTLLSWDWEMHLVGRWRALSPVLRLVGPRWERRNWVGLKRFMESGARTDGDGDPR
jgi:hypothetical protein